MPQENQMDERFPTILIGAALLPAPPLKGSIRKDYVSGGRLLRRCKFALTHAALAAAFGAFLIVAGGVGTALAGDDDDDEPFDKKLFGKFMHALGFVNGTEPGVNYEARPPLVVPPTRELPPPETTGAIAARNPDWPVDPDETRRKEQKKAKADRKPYPTMLRDAYDPGQRLTPAEIAAGKTNKPTDPNTLKQPDVVQAPMTPSELGSKGLFSDFFGIGKAFSNEPEVGTFVREPPRFSLTDPPSGYRTPSPEQPYGYRLKRDVDAKTVPDRQSEGVGRNQ
jgi:hypothetical protein